MTVDNFVAQPYSRSNMSSVIESANITSIENKNVQPKTLPDPKTKLETKDNLTTNLSKDPVIKTNDLQINIKDNNGLAVMGKDDLEIELSGNVEIDKSFLLDKVSKLDVKGIKLKPPVFDKERKQYVISGKAMDVALGIDVPFEIRLGQKDNKLALRVDNWVKRGIIYSELKKALSKEGIESHKENKHLVIETKYTGTFNIPVSKSKNQTAKIESFETNSKNTKFDIDQNGTMIVKFDKVPIKASTDPNKATQKLEKADSASIKFDFSTDDKFANHNIKIEDLDVKANLKSQENEIKNLVGEKTEKQIKDNLGDLSTLDIKNTSANISINGSQKNISATTNIDVKSDNSHVNSNVNIDLNNNKLKVSGENVDIKVKDQELTAQKVSFDKSENGLSVNASGVNATLNYQGTKANIKGDISVDKSGENISADIVGDINAKGENKDIKGEINTSGKHSIKLTSESIDIKVDNVKGKASVNISEKNEEASKKGKNINFDVKNAELDLDANVNNIKLNAKVSEGGVKGNIDEQTKVTIDAKIDINADSKDIKGTGVIKGTDLNVDQHGNIKVNIDESNINASFTKSDSNGGLAVKGQVEGKIDAEISNNGKISVKQDGKFDAQFEKGKATDSKHFDIKAKGKSANFELDKNRKGEEKITVEINGIETAKSDLKLNTTKINATTKGEKVKVVSDGSDLSINTKNASSNFDINVNDRVKTKGSTKDINVKLTTGPKNEGDDILISAQNANAEATIKNKNERLNVEAKTRANVKVHIDKKNDINISTDKAISTDAKLSLKDQNGNNKIETKASAKDFNIGIKDSDGDIAIKVKEAKFTGSVTPNKNINVKTQSKNASDLNINIDESPKSSTISINTKSAMSGEVELVNKANVKFENNDGFNVKVIDSEFTNVEANMNGLKIDGGLKKSSSDVDLKGQGDIQFKLNGKPKGESDVINVNYKGSLGGDVNKKDLVQGGFNISGNTSVKIVDDNIDITNEGKINAKTSSTKFGANADLNIEGSKANPFKVNIDDSGDKTKISVNNSDGGYLNLNNITDLNIGNNNQVTDILKTVQLKSTSLGYKNLSVTENGNKISVDVKSKDMKTFYGNIETSMNLTRDSKTVEIKNGNVSITPNSNLYSLITSKLAQKGIKLEGTPTLKDGVLSFRGQVRSEKGKVISADLSMKCVIQNNQLILNLEDTKLAKVIKDKNIIWMADKALNYTDIEHEKISKTSISLNLDDIFRDLKTTKGINFDSISLKDNKINASFHLNVEDQSISKLSKDKNINNLKNYFKNADYSKISSESILTAYNTIVESGNIKEASLFIKNIATEFSENTNNTELSKAILLISKNKNSLKDGIMDDIILDFTKQIKLGTPSGNNIVKKLPYDVVKNMADIMDRTISQGGSFGLITSEERKVANDMRKLKSIPENKRII